MQFTFTEWFGIGALVLAAVALIVVAVNARHAGNTMKELAQFIAARRMDKTWLDAVEGIGSKAPKPAVSVAAAIIELAGKLLPEEYDKIGKDLVAILQMTTDGQPNYISEGNPEAKG